MKIWNNYGSEHSMNLVMIGHFKTAADAEHANAVIDQIAEQVGKENTSDADTSRYSEAMMELLQKLKVHTIARQELEQFAYDARTTVKGNDVVLTTDEADISAFLKVMVDLGARVEVYSAHDYPDTENGRGQEV
jgi:hypothetical protein